MTIYSTEANNMFNTEDLNKAREHFSEHRYAVIDNILLPKYIKELYKSVTTIDYGYWACNGETHLKFNHNEDKNFKEIRDEYRDNAVDNFSYWHRAYWIHEDKHKQFSDRFPKTTEFTKVVTEDYEIRRPDTTFLELAETVSGFTNMYTDQPSYSYYSYDNWLVPHHDPARWLAYIFYFNPNWKAHWGGQLCIMNQDETTIKTSIEPFGNRLVLMDVSATSGKRINKHFISPVSYIAPYPRYSLAGWFYQKDKDGPSPVDIT
tara:strand:+ start:46 stop:831 length:786 start_codon:yes stop_codon:yes gene_type:complete